MSRIVTFANSAVIVKYAGNQEERLVNFLYQYLPDNISHPAHTQFYLSIDEHEYFHLTHDGNILNISQDRALIAEHLLGSTCYHLADKSHGGLLLHAATVGWRGHGILLPGASGAGKSTLTAWLCHQGFTYLTDELSFIQEDALLLRAFTRPLNLKQPSWTILKSLFTNVQSEQIMLGQRTSLISPDFCGSERKCSAIQPRLIIFPRYQSNSLFKWNKLSTAQAGLALMQCLINARNLPHHGFEQITRLAKNVPAYQMIYSNFTQLEQNLLKILPNITLNMS